MENELILPENYKQTYDKIVKMIETAKHKVFETANFQTVYLFWHIGQELKDNIFEWTEGRIWKIYCEKYEQRFRVSIWAFL